MDSGFSLKLFKFHLQEATLFAKYPCATVRHARETRQRQEAASASAPEGACSVAARERLEARFAGLQGTTHVSETRPTQNMPTSAVTVPARSAAASA